MLAVDVEHSQNFSLEPGASSLQNLRIHLGWMCSAAYGSLTISWVPLLPKVSLQMLVMPVDHIDQQSLPLRFHGLGEVRAGFERRILAKVIVEYVSPRYTASILLPIRSFSSIPPNQSKVGTDDICDALTRIIDFLAFWKLIFGLSGGVVM